MRFGIIAYPKKPLIIAFSGVFRETRCLNLHTSFLWCEGAACCGAKLVWRNDKKHRLLLKGIYLSNALVKLYMRIYI